MNIRPIMASILMLASAVIGGCQQPDVVVVEGLTVPYEVRTGAEADVTVEADGQAFHWRVPHDGEAQGVWFGDTLLTVQHAFVVIQGRVALPEQVWINDEPLGITPVSFGDQTQLARALKFGGPWPVHDDPSTASLDEFVQWTNDWVVFKTARRRIPDARLEISKAPLRMHDELYLIGVNRAAPGGPRSEAVRFAVVQPRDAAFEVPGLIYMQTLDLRTFDGWSGSFVGRLDERSGRIEFVGLFSGRLSTVEGQRVVFVCVRPPESVLDSLATGGVMPLERQGP